MSKKNPFKIGKPASSANPDEHISKIKLLKSPRWDTRTRDECVVHGIDCLMENIEHHIKDKFIFPRIVAHAVGRSIAEMVHIVCVAHVQRMEGWLVDLKGSAPEEWDYPEEPEVPLIDSWARGVIPRTKLPAIESALAEEHEIKTEEKALSSKLPRRGSSMALSHYQGQSPKRRFSEETGAKQGLKGSLRRFSEAYATFSSDLNRKVKFQEDVLSVGEERKGSSITATSSAGKDRKPLSPELDLKQRKGSSHDRVTRRPSSSFENKEVCQIRVSQCKESFTKVRN